MGSISQAIKTQDMEMLTEVVESQVKVYGAALPDEADAMVNTVHGDMPISMVFDDANKIIIGITTITETKINNFFLIVILVHSYSGYYDYAPCRTSPTACGLSCPFWQEYY